MLAQYERKFEEHDAQTHVASNCKSDGGGRKQIKADNTYANHIWQVCAIDIPVGNAEFNSVSHFAISVKTNGISQVLFHLPSPSHS